MFDHKVRVLSENLARGVDRRDFLRKAGSAVFAGIAALAAGHNMALSAAAAPGRSSSIPDRPRCAPPGPFCNIDGNNEPNGCHGAQCFQHMRDGVLMQCRVYYIYAAGCWTTVDGGGYWTCCDCRCTGKGAPTTTCGCAMYSMGPVPLPAGQS
ncbi:MAG TPA: hypothetical protein VEX13_12405 [Chloroflexia bacterium]|nr:hypothetical protein [Chloroflexia bacterium]